MDDTELPIVPSK